MLKSSSSQPSYTDASTYTPTYNNDSNTISSPSSDSDSQGRQSIENIPLMQKNTSDSYSKNITTLQSIHHRLTIHMLLTTLVFLLSIIILLLGLFLKTSSEEKYIIIIALVVISTSTLVLFTSMGYGCFLFIRFQSLQQEFKRRRIENNTSDIEHNDSIPMYRQKTA